MKKLSIVIPTYNERENLPELLNEIRRNLAGVDYEVVIVDDNSPDGTGQLAEELAKEHKNLRVVHRPAKMGLASAIADGLRVANGEFVAVMDADLQHPAELLPKMLNEASHGMDLVIASRYVKGGKIEGWSLWRRIVSKGAIWLAHAVLPKTRKVKDCISGYFTLRRSAVDGVKWQSVGYKAILEVLVKGDYDSVAEVPFTFKARAGGRSKLGLKEYLRFSVTSLS